MNKLFAIGIAVGVSFGSVHAFAQTAAPAAACPEGQARGSDGSCSVTIPATPHQQNLLKGATDPTSPAAGAATQGTPTPAAPAVGGVPATPHQQNVLQPKG